MLNEKLNHIEVAPPYALGAKMFRRKLSLNGTGITEIDEVLLSQWNCRNRSPEFMVASSTIMRELIDLFSQLASSAARWPVYRNEFGVRSDRPLMFSYINKYAATMAGRSATVEIYVHPQCPTDALLFFDKGATYPEIALTEIGYG